MRLQRQAAPATSLIDTARFRKLLQIDTRQWVGDPDPEEEDDLAKTDRIRTLDMPELADEVDENPGFDPYNNASM